VHAVRPERLFVEHSEDFVELTSGKGAMLRADDYKGPALEVVPSADPYVVSDTQKIQQAQTLVQAAGQLPGFNRYQAGLRWLKAMKVPNVDAIYPQPMTQGPDGKPVPAPDFPPPPPDPKMITAQANAQKVQLQAQAQQQQMMETHVKLMIEIQESQAKVQNLLRAGATVRGAEQERGCRADHQVDLCRNRERGPAQRTIAVAPPTCC
jgi:hypothetical protein